MSAGHIRRRGERSWELKFDVGIDAAGKRQTRYHAFKGTKREAQVELTRLLADAQKGHYVDPSKVSVAEFIDRWARDWASTNLSLKTVERYRGLIAQQIVPRIGVVPIQKLRPVHLSELYAKLLREGGVRRSGEGVSARTVGHAHRVLHRALGHAAQWGLVQQNVASLVSPPRVSSAEVEILRASEINDLLDKLRGRSMYMVAALGLGTGLRRGEMLALRWQDIDFTRGQLRVERSLEQSKKGGLRFKEPKTKYGRRTISVPAATLADLRLHKKEQQERWLRLGLGRVPEDALLLGTWNGAMRVPDALSKDWAVTMAALGIKASLHSLRHSHASALIAAGVDVLTISRRLGHASPTITLGVYGHLFSNTDDRAALAMDAAFGKRTE
jgi:integrase